MIVGKEKEENDGEKRDYQVTNNFQLAFEFQFLRDRMNPCDFYNCQCVNHDCVRARSEYLAEKARAPSSMSKGLWNDSTTPKRGWKCIEVYDNLTPSVTCGMCQGTEARYVHVMRHPRAANLSVGCICAGYMEGYFDEIGKEIVKQREEQLRNRTQRRGKWLTRKWGETRNGNPKLKIEGQIIAVFPRRDGYSFMIDGEFSDQQYPTEDEAKLGAFDFLFPSRIRV